MPSITHVITDQNIGGAGLLLYRLLQHLDRERFPSQVLLPQSSALEPLFAKLSLPVYFFPMRRSRSFSLADVGFFCRHFQDHPCDILQTHSALSARLAGKILGVPCLLNTLHCDTPHKKTALFSPLYRTLTHATFATSSNAAERLFRCGIPKQEILMVENGFLPLSPPTKAQKKQAREALSIPDDVLALGISARLAPIKGHKTLIEALHRLKDCAVRFHAFFLGDGEQKEVLKALCRTLGVDTQVTFLGFSSDTDLFYHAIDMHLSCSLGSETASLALAEGMSAALPTIASACPGNRHRVGQGGLFFPVGDSVTLAKCILQMADPAQRAEYAARALARAKELPDMKAMAKMYEQHYLTLWHKAKNMRNKPCFFFRHVIK